MKVFMKNIADGLSLSDILHIQLNLILQAFTECLPSVKHSPIMSAFREFILLTIRIKHIRCKAEFGVEGVYYADAEKKRDLKIGKRGFTTKGIKGSFRVK